MVKLGVNPLRDLRHARSVLQHRSLSYIRTALDYLSQRHPLLHEVLYKSLARLVKEIVDPLRTGHLLTMVSEQVVKLTEAETETTRVDLLSVFLRFLRPLIHEYHPLIIHAQNLFSLIY